jgi:NADH:ubiquinone oxidoreductase subunit 3 (subunit A)
MNIGVVEIIFIIIRVALIVGVLLAIVTAGLLLFRRNHLLESRLKMFEAGQDTSSDKTP